MAIEVILNGDNESAIKELHDLEIIASVEKGNVNARITTEQITLVNQYAQLVRNYISGGANGTTNGIFEGLDLQMNENGVNVFDGYLDFLNDFEIVDPTTVKARIKKHNGNNNFQDQANGLTYGFLASINVIGNNDYINIPYINEKEFNFIEFAFLVKSIYDVTRELESLLKDIPELAADLVAHITGGVTGTAAGAVWSAARLAINITFAALMVVLLINLITELVRYIISPIKYHKGIKLNRLIEIGVNFLGLQYNTSIADLPEIGIMPSKTGIDKDVQQNKLINGIVINQPGVGHPSTADFGYTVGEALELINSTFYAEWTIKNNTLEQHKVNAPWWTQNSPYVLTDILQESIVHNASELVSDKVIVFKTDPKDVNSLENFRGHTYEIRTRPINVNDSRNILMNGFDRVDIPYTLGNRKNALNNFERLALKLFQKIDSLINQFGGSSNTTNIITSRIGVNLLETDYVNIPKMMRLDSNNRLPANSRATWSAKYLYDIYHNEGSFVLNNFGGQYLLYKNVRVPFGFSDFNQLTQNSYFSDSNGRLCKLEQIVWNVSQDFALIDYRVKQKYTSNLQETYIEEA